jgi:signal transduction histidine kinase
LKRFQLATLFRSPFGRSLALTLLVFTLTPMLSLIALSTFTIRSQLQERSLTQLSTVADLLQQSITRWVTTANNQLSDALADPVIAQNATFLLRTTADASRPAQVLSKELAQLKKDFVFADMYLVKQNGSIVVSTNPAITKGILRTDINQLEQNGQHFWGFGTLPITGTTTALAWTPVLDQSQQVLGFLVGEYDPRGLTALLTDNRIGIGTTGESYLIAEGGTVLTPLKNAYSPQPLLYDLPVNDVLLGREQQYSGAFRDYAGAYVLGAVQPLQAPLNAWLVVKQEQSEAFETLFTLARAVIIFTLLLAVLALVAAFLTTRRIVTPVQSLVQAAEAMTRGELKTRVEIDQQDEFGSLSVSFNSMAAELERTFSDLEGSNRSLAHRAAQLGTITRVSQATTGFLDLDRLLSTVANVIQQSFNYYAVILYLLETDDTTLIARAAAGANAEEIVTSGLRWEVGSQPSGKAALAQRLLNAEQISNQSALTPDVLLPDTKSQVSILLMVEGGQKLIGVLDIQSDKADGIGADQMSVLQILADQIAIAIRNAELYKESEEARQTADLANQYKTEFLSNMSHELRTPLNVIIGYTHSMLNRPAMYDDQVLPAPYETAIQTVMTSGHHLLGLINDILDLSKIEAGRLDLELKPTDPMPVLQGVRSTALGLVKKGVQVRVDYPENLPFIMGDELRVRQVLLNLVSNAAKFTEQGSITISARIEGDAILFAVSDTGAGIPLEVQQVLFNRFEQGSMGVTKKHGGTGLGLSISRQLVLMHNGDIWVKSRPGRGSTFFFTIPLLNTDPATGRITNPKRADAENIISVSPRASLFTEPNHDELTLTRQVVLFDSHAETRVALQAALTEAGYDVTALDNADETLAIAPALLPDIVVLHLHADDAQQAVPLAELLRQDESLVTTPILTLPETAQHQNWLPEVLTQVEEALDLDLGRAA